MAEESQAVVEDALSSKYWSLARARLPADSQGALQELIAVARTAGSAQDAAVGSWPERLERSCKRSKEAYEKAQWAISIKGKDVPLHSLWDKAIDALSKLNEIGKLATSAEPMAGLGWSIAQLLIQIPVEKAKVATSVVEGLSKVVVILSRGIIYERQLQMAWSNSDKRNIETFEGFLIDLYEQTLLFLLAASKHYAKGTLRRTWVAVWDSGEISDFDKKTTQIQCDLQAEAQNSFRIGVHGELSALLESQESLQRRLAGLGDGIQTGMNELLLGQDAIRTRQEEQRHEELKRREKEDATAKALQEHRQRMHREKVLKWLSQFPYLDHHALAKEKRVPGTGEWIFGRPDYQRWYRSRNPCLLWIHGIPGAGKTKLISKIVDRFDVRVWDDQLNETSYEWKQRQDLQTAFFYCRKDDESRRNSINILRCIIRQLAAKFEVPPEAVNTTYGSKAPEDAPSRRLTVEECWRMLEGTIQSLCDVVVVIDALDECDEQSIRDLLYVFDRLVQPRDDQVSVKVVVSSRELPEIVNRLNKGAHVGIAARDNGNDISQFVRQRLDEEAAGKITAELRRKIISTFDQKSGAMFQWAAVHLENVLRRPTADDIEEALLKPPKDLDAAYRDTFAAIKADEICGEYAIRAFKWLQARGGRSPIGILVGAASQKIERTADVQSSLVQQDDLLKACHSLLVLEDTIVRFSHLSVQEYCDREESGDYHHFAAVVCLKTLLYHNLSLADPPSILDRLYYDAYRRWWSYARRVRNKKDVILLLRNFLEPIPPSPGCSQWLSSVAIHAMDSNPLYTRTVKAYLRNTQDMRDAEKLASFIFNPSIWVQDADLFLDPQRPFFSDFNTAWPRDSDAESEALLRAFIGGCIVRAKVARASSSNPDLWEPSEKVSGSKSWSSQIIAESQTKRRGKVASVSLLMAVLLWVLIRYIKQYFDTLRYYIRAPGPGAALRSQMVQELHSLEDSFPRVLEALGYLPSEQVSKPLQMLHLLEHPSGLPPQCVQELARMSALCLCRRGSLSSDESSLLNLLMAKYDLYCPIRYDFLSIHTLHLGEHLLHLDALHEVSIVKLLVSNGANVNFQAETNRHLIPYSAGTPLIAAVIKFDRDVVKGSQVLNYLLEQGAEINGTAFMGEFGSALIAACTVGSTDLVTRLLDVPLLKIDLTVTIGKYGTALIAASATCNAAIVKLLLSKGANPNMHATAGEFHTALAAALHKGSATMVMLLLKAGADIDEALAHDLPQDLASTIQRWDFFEHNVRIPILEKYDQDPREWTQQCTVATQQLSVALCYVQVGMPIDWADVRIREAVRCLSFFSSQGATDFRAAKIAARQWGFEDQGNDIFRALGARLREGRAIMEQPGGVLAVVDGLIAMLWALNEGTPLPIVREEATPELDLSLGEYSQPPYDEEEGDQELIGESDEDDEGDQQFVGESDEEDQDDEGDGEGGR